MDRSKTKHYNDNDEVAAVLPKTFTLSPHWVIWEIAFRGRIGKGSDTYPCWKDQKLTQTNLAAMSCIIISLLQGLCVFHSY